MSSVDNSGDGSDPGGETGRFEELLKRAAKLPPVPNAGLSRVRVGAVLCGGRFQVLRRLGEGGMGMVFEAFDRTRGVSVALKTVSQLDAGAIYRLKNEFRSLAEVVHPNLVQLYELFADDAQWLFSMELIAGVPFDLWTRPAGVLDLSRLRAALRQLVMGVRMIHAAGKLHRDLKPSNMLVTEQGRVVILDFGLAADPQPGGAGQTSDAGHTVGTPAYMAPEQAAGLDSQGASDWYAVGVILFEALTGELPFDGKPAAILVDKQISTAPRASERASGVPADLDALCTALLQREPALRPSGEQVEAMLGPEPPVSDRQEPRSPLASAPAVPAAEPAPPDHSLEFPLSEITHRDPSPPTLQSGAPLAAALPHTTSAPPAFAATSISPRGSLVGRERELEVLRGAYAGAAAGRVTVAHVVGESGVGKSTLCAAFLQELRETQPAVVLSGRCYERESVPYKAFDRLVDELSRHLQQLPAVEAAALMPRGISTLARVFPVLERVACVASAPLPTTSDEHELRAQAFAAFVELLARIRDRRPLVLYLDDMQWSDRDSALLLERMFAGAGAPRVLLLVCQRGGAHDGNAALVQALRALREQPGMTFVELPLSPLPLPAATALARKLLHDEVRAAEVAREAGGNPFFVGELCRYVLEAAAHGERPLVALEHALERRMARTSASATRLLALLAISGRPTPVPVLAAACRDGAGSIMDVDVHGELHVLRGAQLVRASSERGYECYHDRIRVALAERIPTAEQAELHLSLARAWELGGEADPEVLFEHRLAGGERERAAEHALAAASKAFAGLAFERSAGLYRQAIALLPVGAVQGRDLEERLGEALSRAGRWAESGEAFARAATYGGARAGYLEQQAALHLLGSGRYDQGMPRLQRAFRLLGLSWPRTSWGSAIGALARLLWLRFAGERALRRKLVPLTTRPTQAETLPLEVLLTAASLVPPYDGLRGLYLLTVFVLRGLRSRAADDVAFALGMLSTVMATWSPMRGFAQRLADRALELLHEQPELGDDVAAGLLGLIGFARVLDFRLADGLALGAQGSERLRRSNRSYAFHAWGARSVQCFALSVMGRMGEAAKLYAATEQEARDQGDELAAVAGSSVLRYLVDDDVPRAEQLIAHKLAFLARVPSSGLLHPMVSIERVTLALYTGRGGDVMHLVPAVSQAGMMQLQPLALSVACALQAIDQYGRDPALVKLVKRARARVPNTRDDATSGLRAQIDACIAGLQGDRAQAIAEFERAIAHYDSAGMGLHAAGMRLRCGELRGDDGGRELAAQAARFMRSQGIVNVEAWGMFLAPGLGHLRGASRG